MVCLSNSDSSAHDAAGVVICGAISQGFCEALQRALTDGNGGLYLLISRPVPIGQFGFSYKNQEFMNKPVTCPDCLKAVPAQKFSSTVHLLCSAAVSLPETSSHASTSRAVRALNDPAQPFVVI
jgi:hypothetical protein